MKILLVNPPRSPHNAILAHAPEHARRFIHRRLVGPPLGLLTLAAAVRDHEVELLETKGIYDLDANAPSLDALVRSAISLRLPDVVGVTVIASEFPAAMTILHVVKEIDPTIVTVAGGLHATLCPGDFDHPDIDVVCPGMANRTFPAIVAAIEEHQPLDGIGGIGVRREGRLRWNAGSVDTGDPAGSDYLAPDRRHVAPYLKTYMVGNGQGPATYLFTSLGCPFRCTFCSIWPQFGGRVHTRSVESIVGELLQLDEYPIVRFADANTVVDTAFVDALFTRIIAEGIRKEFIMDMRMDTIAGNPGLVEKLARGGLKVVICGFESFRQEELLAYRKHADVANVDEAVGVLHRNGIQVRGNYIVPPDYDVADFDALAEFAGQRAVAFAGYTILTPMPGTVFYEQAKPRIIDDDPAKYNFFNCVMQSRLPIDEFHARVGGLWAIRKGLEVI
jgi:radical SAM superfamily enzyme YgiQ (UPF0313 family)